VDSFRSLASRASDWLVMTMLLYRKHKKKSRLGGMGEGDVESQCAEIVKEARCDLSNVFLLNFYCVQVLRSLISAAECRRLAIHMQKSSSDKWNLKPQLEAVRGNYKARGKV
jgi:hypothetical protein